MVRKNFSNKKKKNFWKIILASFIFLSVASVAAIVLTLFNMPKLDTVEDYHPPQVSRVYDRNKELIGEFFIERRTVIDTDTLPAYIKNAFIAAEDADFYHHKGIDYLGLVRAVLNEIKYQLIGGRRVGGSTITQQTAKTMLLSHKRTYSRKLKELLLAKRIEDRLTKKEILDLYLNQIYFGQGAYGIEEAAQVYFGIPAYQLSINQAATLAGLPQSPNRINPIADPIRAKNRREYVLGQMLEHHFITENQARQARKEPILVKNNRSTYLNIAPYFVEAVRLNLINDLGEEAVNTGGLSVYTPLDGKMQIAANLAVRKGLRELDKRQGYRGPIFRPKQPNQSDALNAFQPSKNLRVNQIVQARVNSIPNASTVHVDLGGKIATMSFSTMKWARTFNPEKYTPPPQSPHNVLKVGDIIWVKINTLTPKPEVSLEQLPQVEGALVAMDPFTREIRSMVGGYDFATSNYNRAIQAKRQPGSSFKPIIYATAINQEAITPATIITDAPKVYFNGGEGEDNQWKPSNVTKRFMGDITVRTCLYRSVNTCSITILEKIGIKPVLDFSRSIGLMKDNNPFPRDLTLALGTGEVTLLDHVNAYATFPSLGQYGPPVFVDKVISANGTVLQETANQLQQVLKPQTAFIITQLLRNVIDRNAASLTAGLRRPLAGKTGTTNKYRSVWFMGYSPNLVAGIYVGFDNNRSLGVSEYAIRNAMPIWTDFMREAQKELPEADFEQPEGIVWRFIDEKTGLLSKANASSTPSTPKTDEENPDLVPETDSDSNQSVWEAFIAGTEPTQEKSKTSVPFELLDMGSF